MVGDVTGSGLLAVIGADVILALPLYREGLLHGSGNIVELGERYHAFVQSQAW